MTNPPLPPMSPAARKFFTQDQYARLIDNGRRQAGVKGTKAELDPYPVVKLFFAAGAGTWLLTELEPDEPDIAWGLCDLGMGFAEFGTVSLIELAAIKRFRLGVERDRHFKATAPISRYIDAATDAGHIVERIAP
jgi:Protein of unknown function (DUF2958)